MADTQAAQRMQDVDGRRLRFRVTARPVPKARPRVVAGHAYTPARTSAFEKAVGWAAKQAMAQAGWGLVAGPVLVDLVIAGARSNADVDNLAKAVLDGMQHIVFEDDRQIVGLAVWRESGSLPGIRVEVVAFEQKDTEAE